MAHFGEVSELCKTWEKTGRIELVQSCDGGRKLPFEDSFPPHQQASLVYQDQLESPRLSQAGRLSGRPYPRVRRLLRAYHSRNHRHRKEEAPDLPQIKKEPHLKAGQMISCSSNKNDQPSTTSG